MATLRISKRPTSTDGSCGDNEMNWALGDPNEVPPVSYTNPVSVLATPAIPRWVFPATPRAVSGFDYGIMARSSSKSITANGDYALPSYSYPQNVNELPKDFMLASKMLSIRDPWEEARASKPPITFSCPNPPSSFKNEKKY